MLGLTYKPLNTFTFNNNIIALMRLINPKSNLHKKTLIPTYLGNLILNDFENPNYWNTKILDLK